jgi:hypothetical protein
MNKNTSPEFRFTVLNNLVYNEDFCRRVLPYVKEDYFVDDTEKSIFKEIKNHVDKYNSIPTAEVLRISLENNLDDEETYKSSLDTVNAFDDKQQDTDWLLETTEDWCQYRATYLAIMQSVKIMNGEDKTLTMQAVPTLLSDALAVSFDQHVGHDYFIDYEHRYDYLHKVENRVPFGLDILNTITKGGLTPGTLTVLLAGCVHPDTKVKVRIRKKN